MITANMEKIRKQNSLSSELIIKMGLLVAIIGLLYVAGASFSVVAGVLPCIQSFKACIAIIRACNGSDIYGYFNHCIDYSYFIINILN
jgi:hypothetical protein